MDNRADLAGGRWLARRHVRHNVANELALIVAAFATVLLDDANLVDHRRRLRDLRDVRVLRRVHEVVADALLRKLHRCNCNYLDEAMHNQTKGRANIECNAHLVWWLGGILTCPSIVAPCTTKPRAKQILNAMHTWFGGLAPS